METIVVIVDEVKKIVGTHPPVGTKFVASAFGGFAPPLGLKLFSIELPMVYAGRREGEDVAVYHKRLQAHTAERSELKLAPDEPPKFMSQLVSESS